MSGRDDGPTAPGRAARRQSSAYPRVTASLSVNLAAHDRRAAAVLRSGAIGGCAPFEMPPNVKERRSPGELGPARDSDRARPRATRRSAAPAAEGGSEGWAAASGGGDGGARRRPPLAVVPSAPTTGFAGLPGLGVFLGELGSPAKPPASAGSSAGATAAGLLGARLRAAPSLVDVSVSIGGDPGRGMSRWMAPLRALAAKRSSRAATGMAVPTMPTAARAAPVAAATPAAPAAPSTPMVAPALDSAAPPARAGGLRRASRYIVNGILDIAIRRFRAGWRGSRPRLNPADIR